MNLRVIGGGILGMASALALAERGHDVTLLEKEQLGSGATHKAAGILSTMTWSPQEYQLIAETRGMVGELIALALCEGATNARNVWRPEESLLIAKRGDPRLDLVQKILEDNTEEPERFIGHVDEAPGVRVEADEEVLVAQEDGVLDAGEMVTALATRLEGEGVIIQQGKTVNLTEGEDTDFDGTIVAGGAWTANLLEQVNFQLPAQAYRTQLATLEMPATPIVHDLVKGFYVRPESKQTILAGDGTRLHDHDPDAYDEANDTQFRDHIAQSVASRFVDGPAAKWRTGWAGLCVGTPDRHPICGAVPGHDNLWVLTGDNGFGLMRSLALGEKLADAVSGDEKSWLSPARFTPEIGRNFQLREGFGDLEN